MLISAVFLAFTYDDQSRRAETDLLEKSRVLVTEMDAMWDFISLNQNVINYTSDGEYDYKGLHCAIAASRWRRCSPRRRITPSASRT